MGLSKCICWQLETHLETCTGLCRLVEEERRAGGDEGISSASGPSATGDILLPTSLSLFLSCRSPFPLLNVSAFSHSSTLQTPSPHRPVSWEAWKSPLTDLPEAGTASHQSLPPSCSLGGRVSPAWAQPSGSLGVAHPLVSPHLGHRDLKERREMWV